MGKGMIQAAVITGGHGYQVVPFHRLFRGLRGIEAYIQHLDDFCTSPEDVRNGYDVLVFYFMPMEFPSQDAPNWHQGNPREVLARLGESDQGLLILHHALLAYPRWETWSEIVGISDRSFGYHEDQELHVHVADPFHPIVSRMKDWSMIDETYVMAGPREDSRILLTVDHPRSMKQIAWTREYRDSRVFCLESGHDSQTWKSAGFQKVLGRGIRWCAGRM